MSVRNSSSSNNSSSSLLSATVTSPQAAAAAVAVQPGSLSVSALGVVLPQWRGYPDPVDLMEIIMPPMTSSSSSSSSALITAGASASSVASGVEGGEIEGPGRERGGGGAAPMSSPLSSSWMHSLSRVAEGSYRRCLSHIRGICKRLALSAQTEIHALVVAHR